MSRTREIHNNLTPAPEIEGGKLKSKHRRVYERLLESIQSGALKPGDRLPSEAELGKMFEASRITVAKAVHDLQRMGLVSRRRGAGARGRGGRGRGGRAGGGRGPGRGRAGGGGPGGGGGM